MCFFWTKVNVLMEGIKCKWWHCVCAQFLNHTNLFATLRTVALCSWNCPGKNTRLDCHFLLQRIFQTQGPNPCLLHLLHGQVDFFSPLGHLGFRIVALQTSEGSRVACDLVCSSRTASQFKQVWGRVWLPVPFLSLLESQHTGHRRARECTSTAPGRRAPVAGVASWELWGCDKCLEDTLP